LKYSKMECGIVTSDGFCSAPSSSSPPQRRTRRVPAWPQTFPYRFWASELKTRIQKPAGNTRVRWQTHLPFPECVNETEPRRGGGGRGDSPQEPQLKQNQSRMGCFIFQHGEALEVQISTDFCIARQLKKGWWMVNPASARLTSFCVAKEATMGQILTFLESFKAHGDPQGLWSLCSDTTEGLILATFGC